MPVAGVIADVQELKGVLKLLNERVSGKKDELYQRAVKALEARGLWADPEVADLKKPSKKAKKSGDGDDYDW